jgi:streptogramin lyase
LRWISGDSHWDTERIVAHSDRKYLAVCEVWIALFQYSDSALGEIDLHDTAAEKVDAQNPIDRLVTAVAKRAEIDSQDRFWKSYTAACRLQIVYAISKALPIHALHSLPIA